ncbi:MAG: cytochrome P460 family protein [Pseudomonadota bacterium]
MSGRAIALAIAGVLAAVAVARTPDNVYFPQGYRDWQVVKFKLIGPGNPNYERQGGFRHHFANPTALGSWGHFRDGSVIVDERVLAAPDEHGVWQAGLLGHVAVMRKDRKHFADTGGWYFNVFSSNDTAIGLTPAQAKAACFDACHKAQAARDFVFSDPRR